MLYTPRSVYGLSKLLDEVMLRKYAARHAGLRWVSLRYGNVCGADPAGFVGEAKRKPHTLMTLAMYSLLKHHAKAKGLQQGLHLYGHDYDTPDGTTVRDYVHPTDLAKAHVEALKYLLDGRPSDIFNLGTGKGSSVLEVLRAVEHESGRKVDYAIKERRQGDCAFSVLDISLTPTPTLTPTLTLTPALTLTLTLTRCSTSPRRERCSATCPPSTLSLIHI